MCTGGFVTMTAWMPLPGLWLISHCLIPHINLEPDLSNDIFVIFIEGTACAAELVRI